MVRVHSGDRGFTLMEILIAIIILVVGLVGIMSLFPAAIKSGNQTVQDSYAASIAQSVLDAINVGLRENRITHSGGVFFIFQHDGVLAEDIEHISNPDNSDDYDDLAGADKANAIGREFTIVLPIDSDKTLIYPMSEDSFSSLDASSLPDQDELDPPRQPEVVFDLAQAADAAEDDPYYQYGFAIKIKRARLDTNEDGNIDASDDYSNALFEVTIMIYRNFNEEAPNSKNNEPIREFATLVAL